MRLSSHHLPILAAAALTAIASATLAPGCATEVTDAGAEATDVGGFDAAGFETIGSLDVGFTPEDAATSDTGTSGSFLTPCQDNAECFSGWCVDSPEGDVCTKNCEDDSGCPDGWSCSQVSAGGADPAFICVANDARLCRPCESDDDCNVPGFPTQGLCIETGPQGSFCTRGCGDGLSLSLIHI